MGGFEVGIKVRTPRSGVQFSTIRMPCSPCFIFFFSVKRWLLKGNPLEGAALLDDHKFSIDIDYNSFVILVVCVNATLVLGSDFVSDMSVPGHYILFLMKNHNHCIGQK